MRVVAGLSSHCRTGSAARDAGVVAAFSRSVTSESLFSVCLPLLRCHSAVATASAYRVRADPAVRSAPDRAPARLLVSSSRWRNADSPAACHGGELFKQVADGGATDPRQGAGWERPHGPRLAHDSPNPCSPSSPHWTSTSVFWQATRRHCPSSLAIT